MQWRGWRESRDEGAALMEPLLRGVHVRPPTGPPSQPGVLQGSHTDTA